MTSRPADDRQHMRRALQLARRGQGRVEPNPMVGCVITRGPRVLAEGYHRRFGGLHAEVEALRRCDNPRGATVYVTLEPCCHHGKTPPCVDALLAAGVRRVVAAIKDPNPAVQGRGIARLRRAGIDVDLGICEAEAIDLIAPFIKLQMQRRPWVILKWAQSIDGKIATRTGDSKWISDEACRAHAHRVRGRLDGIIVGVGTVLTDDPLLTCRVGRPRRIATRIVLDRQLRTPLRSQLVQTAADVPTWIMTARSAPAERARRLERAGCRIQRIPVKRGTLALDALLDILGAAQMSNVLVEGGGRVLGALADAQLGDEYHIYLAPRLIGGAAAIGPLHGAGVPRISDANPLPPPLTWRRLGDGWLLTTRPSSTEMPTCAR